VPHATNPQAPAGSARLGWIDTARGLTMIFVVLLHADVVAQAMGRSSLLITLFDYALYPMRMPMFFLVSGMLSAGLVSKRSTGEVMRRRVLHYAWLYALWSTIYAVVHAWALRDLGPPGMQVYYNNVEGPIEALVVTWNNTWFLYALGLFYAVALAMRRLPVAAQVAITLALATPGLFRLGLELGVPVLDRFYHFPYFMLGILGGNRLRDAIPRLGRWQTLALMATTCLLLAGLAHHLRILREPAVIAALSVLAMPSELATALLITRHLRWLAAALQVIGRNTLAVYVLHTITLRLLLALTPPLLPPVVQIPLLTLTAIALAIAIGRPLQRHLPFLFALPGAARRARVQAAPAE